jgi:hypothetical protein
LSRPIIVRPLRESLEGNGIIPADDLQQTFATKSSNSGPYLGIRKVPLSQSFQEPSSRLGSNELQGSFISASRRNHFTRTALKPMDAAMMRRD